ncbi:M20/M25/M40 family metallo-hydrolase [Candidatus Dojkabacteria bacterium]|nr:M20/M25/M40 family metallo-hydrolase [Candidatus Dojkabacteria bacterium]
MKLVELFKELVAIDSPSGEEQEVSDYICKYLKSLGLEPIQDENFMIYCQVGEVSEKSVLFCAHLDTVEPGRGIRVIEEDGYLKSDGNTILGADNKAAVTAILSAVEKLIEDDAVPECGIELLFTVREETDAGIRLFDRNLLRSKVAYVFDEGDGELNVLIKKAPTIQDFVITIEGRSAHAARPEQGINALKVFSYFLSKTKLGKYDKLSNLNIGLFTGGSATNTVPDRVVAKGDLRSLNHERFLEIQAEVDDALDEASRKFGSRFSIEWIPYSFAYELDQSNSNFKALKSTYRNKGLPLRLVQTTGGSDAGLLNHVGIESYSLGSGVENAHSCDERIRVRDLEVLRAVILSLFIGLLTDIEIQQSV